MILPVPISTIVDALESLRIKYTQTKNPHIASMIKKIEKDLSDTLAAAKHLDS